MSRDERLEPFAKLAGFRLTPTLAHQRYVCVKCERQIGGAWTRADLAEWALSALCPSCFDEIMARAEEAAG